jgi:hypothetical protein
MPDIIRISMGCKRYDYSGLLSRSGSYCIMYIALRITSVKGKGSGSDTKVCGIKGDGSVETCITLFAHGIESKQFICEKMKNIPGGVHLVLEGTHEKTEENWLEV